jgi:hypothetical protein
VCFRDQAGLTTYLRNVSTNAKCVHVCLCETDSLDGISIDSIESLDERKEYTLQYNFPNDESTDSSDTVAPDSDEDDTGVHSDGGDASAMDSDDEGDSDVDSDDRNSPNKEVILWV